MLGVFMKATNLIIVSLMTASSWAVLTQTYVFFAKVNDTLEPLRTEDNENPDKLMVWGDLSANPTEFYYINNRAYSSSESNPGVIEHSNYYSFHFDQSSKGNDLILNKQIRLKNSFFYSCLHPSTHLKTMYSIYSTKVYPNCFAVEIYFLPYDREIKAPVIGSYTPEKEVERTPHVFFIEGKNDLEPLYSVNLKPIHSYLVPFNHGNKTTKPLEFFFQDDYAITEHGGVYSGYAGSLDGFFGFGAYVEMKLNLDKNMKFSSQRSFSCKDSRTTDRMITLDPSIATDCFEVEMYLLPYNRTNQRPMEGSYKEENKNRESNLSAILNQSYVFFIRVNGILKHLSFYTEFDDFSGKEYGVFFYQKSWVKPVEFTMNNKVVYTKNTAITGFAALYRHQFVFGGSTPQYPFDIDSQSKIRGQEFYSCPENIATTQRNVILDTQRWYSCFKAEIYLLPYHGRFGRHMEAKN